MTDAPRPRWLLSSRRALIGTVAAGALVHVVTLFPTAVALYRAVPAGSRPLVVALSTSLGVAALACALALLLVVRAGARHEARGLALFLALVALCWGSVLRFASLDGGPGGVPTGLTIEVSGRPVLIAVFALTLASASLLSLSARFPTSLVERAHSRASWTTRPWLPWLLALVTTALLPGLSVLGRGARSLGVPVEVVARVFPWMLGSIVALIATVVFGMIGRALTNFLKGYRLANEEARRTALWLVAGISGSGFAVLAAALLIVVEVALPGNLGLVSRYTPVVVFFAPLIMVGFVAVAILYSGAVDPRLALRRSTINGVAGTLGLLVFAGLENSLSAWVQGRLGLPDTLGSFLAGGVAAAVFVPVRHLLTRAKVAPTAPPPATPPVLPSP